MLLKPSPTKSIQLLGFWYELAKDWDNNYYFSFRYGESERDYFRKSTIGVGAMNLYRMSEYSIIPPNTPLIGYIKVVGEKPFI